MSEINIRQLNETDWQKFAQTRLKALQTDPKAFGSNYERESKMTETEWREKLRAKDNAIFLLCEGNAPIGITCVSIDRNDQTGKTAILWGSWLAPEFRRRGLSELMYQTRIEWAKHQPTVEKIIVSHRASNLASKYANQKHGFVLTHKHDKTWSDGEIEEEFYYELKIKS